MKKLAFLFATAALMVSCGGNNEESTESTDPVVQPETTVEEPTVSETETVTADVYLELLSDDKMQFDKNELKVGAGQTVALTLKHTGEMDKTVMGHNFVLLQQGVDMNEFATKAMAAKETDYIPEDQSEIIAYTKTIGGGESVTITFEAPEVGTYDYLCSFPGHYGIMNGKFIVE